MKTTDLEYYMFSNEDPIAKLKDLAMPLNVSKKRKIAPYINRANAMLRKSQAFREMILNEPNDEIIEIMSSTFVLYFDACVDKGKFISIAQDPAFEFVKYVSGLMANGIRLDDKYLKKVNTLICNNSNSIDYFIKAFLSIRLAQGELNKLLTV